MGGLGKKLKGLAKEYKRDPKGQYFNHLHDMLNIHKASGVTVKEVLDYVKRWGETKLNKT